jgi:hypothetical protein
MGALIRISRLAPRRPSHLAAGLYEMRTMLHETRISSGGRNRTDDPGLMNPML